MQKKRPSAGVRILLGFLSLILCLLLFVSALAAMLVADVRVLTDRGNLQQLITQSFFSAPVRTPVRHPAGLAAGRPVVRSFPTDILGDLGQDVLEDLDGDVLGELGQDVLGQMGLTDTVYDALTEHLGEEVPVSKDQVETLLEESTVPEFVAEKAAGIVSDIFTGESTVTVTKEEIVDLMKENAPLIEETFDIPITEAHIDRIAEAVEQSRIVDTIQQQVSEITGLPLPAPGTDATEPASPSFGISESDREILSAFFGGGEFTAATLPALLNALRAFSSQTMLLLCIGVCLLLTALLFLVNCRNLPAAMRRSGIPYLCAGILLLIPSAFAALVPGVFAGSVGSLLRQILLLTGSVSLTVTVIGLVLIIGGSVVGALLRKKRETPAAAPAADGAPAASVTGISAEETSAALTEEEATQTTEV